MDYNVRLRVVVEREVKNNHLTDWVIESDCDEDMMTGAAVNAFETALRPLRDSQTGRFIKKPLFTEEMFEAVRKAHRRSLEDMFKTAKRIARSRSRL